MENIKLYNQDCLDVFKTIQNESVDLIVTDPPYRMTSRGGTGSTGGMLLKDIVNSGKVFNNYDIDCEQYAHEFYRVLKDGSHCYVMTNNINLIHMLNTFTQVGFHFIRSLIWDKCRKIMGTFYMSQYEYILFFRKGKGIPINNPATSDILSIPVNKLKLDNGQNVHDTEKPVELMQILIENSSKVNDVVFDPFMGIGATAIACKKLNRNFIGCEIEKSYYDYAQQRLNSTAIKKSKKQTSLF